MLNETIEAIAITLHGVFGDGYEIYRDSVQQGLQEPCFLIGILKPEITPIIGNRLMERNPFDIQYFPNKQGDHTELFMVAKKLMLSLDFLTLQNGDKLRGIHMSYEIIDHVLHFFVQYSVHMQAQTQKTYMETLQQNWKHTDTIKTMRKEW